MFKMEEKRDILEKIKKQGSIIDIGNNTVDIIYDEKTNKKTNKK